MSKEKQYEKAIFQLNDFIRHLLLDSDDVKKCTRPYWFEYWDKIEKENKEILNSIYNAPAN